MGSSTENMINKEEEEEEEVEEREDNKEVEAEERMSLPGFRFHPTDEELVSFYLRRKVEKRPLDLIKQVDIYKYDPWDLPKVSTLGEKEWYFFCMRGRKYRNSVRPNRVTGSGFWKATGIDKPIYAAKDPHECVGLKKCLVYYRGSAGKGTKTDWMMHEFRLPPNGKTAANIPSTVKDIAQEAEVWTLCRIFKRIQSYKKYTPDSKQNTNINQSPTVDSCSITSSLESECINSYANLRGNRGPEMKPVIDRNFADDRNGLFWGHINGSIAQQPISYSTYPGIWNMNGEDLYNHENWDELRKVVERSIDHHQQQQSLDFDCTDNHVTY